MPRRHTNKKHAPLPSGAVSTCDQKKRYRNQDDAQKAAELSELRDLSLELTVYQCPYCRFWHLTRKQPER
jgi:hypothetical protein